MGAGSRILRPFLTREDKELIKAMIAVQEARTTGEIRVHVMARAGRGDILEIAQRKFVELRLQNTAQRNGVLILISRWDRQYAIWGDEGLHSAAGDPLWARAKEALDTHFRMGHFAAGIIACIREIGDELVRHFPNTGAPDSNELSDDISED